MVERTETENRRHPIVREKLKCMRFMQVGLSCILAWPVAIMLAAMYGLENMVPIMSVVMVMIGVVVFAIGYVGRQELRGRQLKGREGKNG
jgi:hypothetical protein